MAHSAIVVLLGRDKATEHGDFCALRARVSWSNLVWKLENSHASVGVEVDLKTAAG